LYCRLPNTLPKDDVTSTTDNAKAAVTASESDDVPTDGLGLSVIST